MPVERASFTVRPYHAGDEAQILDLFRRCFHSDRSLEHWRWKFQTNPWGVERISLAFDSDGKLVGHFGGYAMPFRDRGEDFVAHQMGDSMTDPAARHLGRGPSSVFGRCMAQFYESFSYGRIAFNYGFNVGNVQKFFLRFLNGQFVMPVAFRRRDLTAHPLRSPGRISRLLHGYSFELVSSVDDEWDELFDRAWGKYEFLVRRDARYVRWRYLEAPEPYFVVAVRARGRLAGWSAFRVREERLVWGDAFFDSDHARAAGLMLRHVAAQFPVSIVEGWFPDRPSWFGAILDHLGMPVSDEPQGLGMIAAVFEKPDAVERMRTALYYTMGDGDLF